MRVTSASSESLHDVLSAVISGRSVAPGDLLRAAESGALVAAARQQRIASLLLRWLEAQAGAPERLIDDLASARPHGAMHHLMALGVATSASAAFEAAAIPHVVMKGPTVARLYEVPADRTYADLDFLVGAGDFGRAIEILESRGCRSAIRNWALAEEMVAGQIEMKGAAVDIDLHWELHYSADDRRPYAFPIHEMIARRRGVSVDGVQLATFDAPDTLITLAFHAARSGGHRLLWLKDIDRAVAIDRPDFDEVVRRARAYRCAPAVGLMLQRTNRVLGTDVAVEAVKALIPGPLRAADRVVTSVSNPIRLRDGDSLAPWFTRSVRASTRATLSEMPSRAFRLARRRLQPPPPNETDDPAEKARYLAAVAMEGGAR
jgi:hypothetical protein